MVCQIDVLDSSDQHIFCKIHVFEGDQNFCAYFV